MPVWNSGGITAIYTLPNYSAAWFNAYQVISANDVPGRDPKHWKMYGSLDDGATWILLDEQTRTESFPGRNTIYTYPLRSNDKVFTKLKWEFLENFGSGHLQLSQLRVVANNQPLIIGLQYESPTFTTSIFTPFTITPISSGYMQYTTQPNLPAGVSINTETGVISGTFETGVNQAYTISAVNRLTNQPGSFTLTITVASCSQPNKVSLEIRKTNSGSANHERWTIYNSANAVVTSGQGTTDGSAIVVSDCFDADNWRVLLQSDNGKGWNHNDFLDISYRYSSTQSFRIAHLHMLSGSTEEFRVNTRFEYAGKSAWKYLAGSVPTGWNTAAFSDASWQTLAFNPPTQVTQRIVLLRKTFTATTVPSTMKAWQLYFKSKAGVVIFINGNEVYRDYLPAGEISSSTSATGGGDSFTWKSVSGPISAVSSSITIAVGLFGLDVTAYNVEFDAVFNFRSGNNVPLELSGSSYNTDNVGMEGSAANAFDGRTDSRWITGIHDSVTPYYFQITFANRKTEYINKYCVISGWDAPRHDVADWTLQGIMSDNTMVNITTEVNVSWEARRQRQCFYINNPSTAYRGIRFIAQRAVVLDSSNRYVVSELEFYQENMDTITIPPLAFTTSDYKTYRGIAAAALTCTSEYYHNFQITPALPAPLTMDSSNGYINGVPAAVMPRTQYTVTATSIKGVTSTTTLFVTIEVCGGTNTLFNMALRFDYGSASEASWEIRGPNGNTIGSEAVAIQWATVNYGFCVPNGVYSFIFADSANDGWGDGDYTVTLEDGTVILFGSVANGESPKTVQVNIGRIVNNSGNNWKLLDGSAPASGWTTLGFNDNSWTTATSEYLPAVTGTTQYYRLKFTYTGSLTEMAALEVSAKTYAGMILYLNGQEVRRVNLPASGVTHTTLATAEYSDYIMVATVLNRDNLLLVNGENILAVEVHKMTTIPATNKFDCMIASISNNEYRGLHGTSSSDIAKTGFEGIDSMFDNNIQTKMLTGPRCEGAWFQWTYNDLRREMINQYTVVNGNDCNQRHPSAWILEASNDNENWVVLHYADKQYFTDFRQAFTYTFYNTIAYNSYRMTVTECANAPLDTVNCGSGNIQLSELGFYTSIVPLSCAPLDGFSGAPEGGYGYKNCNVGYQGYQRRSCTGGVFSAQPQEFCNLVAPRLVRYSAKSYVLTTGRENTVPAPFTIAAEHQFNVTTALPAGLTLNKNTGAITGTPVADFTEKTFQIVVYNVKGSITTEITLSSHPPNDGMTGGVIAIVVIAVIIIVIFIAFLVFCILNRTKKSNKGHKKLGNTKKPAGGEKKAAGASKVVKV